MLILLALIALILLWRIAHHAKRNHVKRYRPDSRAGRRVAASAQRQHLAAVETALASALREQLARTKANPTARNSAVLADMNARLAAKRAQR